MVRWAYYNEIDEFAADWLELLIMNDLIAPGYVDRRSIIDVQPDDVREFAQVHLCAGIGGWSYALRLAGVPDDAPIWTASFPCQPFSQAGKHKGEADERHLWPEGHRLIRARQPARVFGEQVASKLGREWLARVRADLEALGYGVGAADLCAASVGAPHIRQRLYWMAYTDGGDASAEGLQRGWEHGQQPPYGCAGDWLADAERHAREPWGLAGEPGEGPRAAPAGPYAEPGRRSDTGGLAHAQGAEPVCDRSEPRREQGGLADSRGVGDANDSGSQGWSVRGRERRDQRAPWATGVFIPCADGRSRRIEPSIFPLAHGISNRMGTLRGSGNAIVPQVAAAFIEAGLKACSGTV